MWLRFSYLKHMGGITVCFCYILPQQSTNRAHFTFLKLGLQVDKKGANLQTLEMFLSFIDIKWMADIGVTCYVASSGKYDEGYWIIHKIMSVFVRIETSLIMS